MKKLILSLAVMAFLGAGCSSDTGKQEAAHEHGADTHEHGADSHEHGSEAAHDELTLPKERPATVTSPSWGSATRVSTWGSASRSGKTKMRSRPGRPG